MCAWSAPEDGGSSDRHARAPGRCDRSSEKMVPRIHRGAGSYPLPLCGSVIPRAPRHRGARRTVTDSSMQPRRVLRNAPVAWPQGGVVVGGACAPVEWWDYGGEPGERSPGWARSLSAPPRHGYQRTNHAPGRRDPVRVAVPRRLRHPSGRQAALATEAVGTSSSAKCTGVSERSRGLSRSFGSTRSATGSSVSAISSAGGRARKPRSVGSRTGSMW